VRIYVFVEGPSDVLALYALWNGWLPRLGHAGHGIRVIPLSTKAEFLKKIGHRAAEKLADNPSDFVVGLPDLYPNAEYTGDRFHKGVADLAAIQQSLVKKSLEQDFQWTTKESDRTSTDRFCASAFKHDSEMLLLASKAALRSHLRTDHNLGKWIHPVENQNQFKPPKRVVEDLFLQYRKTAYRDTKDAKAVLDRVSDMSQVLFDDNRQVQCPVFKGVVDWIAQKTGVSAYDAPK
jgi:hypothetical protein